MDWMVGMGENNGNGGITKGLAKFFSGVCKSGGSGLWEARCLLTGVLRGLWLYHDTSLGVEVG